jgi:uncharacterized protein
MTRDSASRWQCADRLDGRKSRPPSTRRRLDGGPTRSTLRNDPITQGTLLRLLIRNGIPADDAIELLEATTVHPNHRFWTDDAPYDSAVVSGVIGHRQVTDAYLAAQARLRNARLATFDAGLAAAHPDVVELIPTA